MKTEWPQTSESVRIILDAYLAYVREFTRFQKFFPYEKAAKDWVAGAYDLEAELAAYHIPESEWPIAVKWVCDEAQRRDTTNLTPRSVKGYVRLYARRRNSESAGGVKFLQYGEEGWDQS